MDVPDFIDMVIRRARCARIGQASRFRLLNMVANGSIHALQIVPETYIPVLLERKAARCVYDPCTSRKSYHFTF